MISSILGGYYKGDLLSLGAGSDEQSYQSALGQLNNVGINRNYSNALATAPQLSKQDIIDAVMQVQAAERERATQAARADDIPEFKKNGMFRSDRKKLLLLA